MFLKKIEIVGFKSFASKTMLDFFVSNSSDGEAPGITAVVGPNGSGKSNVADAIRWVMGEQSMKNLRGKKSEDVIFSGSGKKSRQSYASATLFFDNTDKKIPVEFEEVSITRKLFRSGESEYLINGSRVRLIDVVDTLAKAGVGKESYSVVNQGMTDAILEATPGERKIILEDAAGVKQYQIKKTRALKKLESTKNNLERVSGLIVEIEPHLKMLKRQADKARKGKEVKEKLQERQMEYYSYLWNRIQSDRDGFYFKKEKTGKEIEKIEKEVGKMKEDFQKESDSFQNSTKKDDLEKEKNKLFQKVNEIEKELAIGDGKREILVEKKKATSVVRSIPVDLQYVKSGLERIRGSQDRLIKRIDEVENLEQVHEVKEVARAVQQDMHGLYKDVGKGKVNVGKTSEQIEKEKKLDKEIETLKKEEKKLKNNLYQINDKIKLISEDIAKEIENHNKSREKFFQLERDLNSKQNDLNRLKDIFNEAKIKLARIEVREEDLTDEIQRSLKMDARKLKPLNKSIDEGFLEREINRLKVQMEQIGGINPMVVDEYEEIKERYDFLTQESKDLEQAIRSLNKISREMDKKIEVVFAKAFVQINKEFSKYFQIIFGGGKAKLIKTKKKISKGSKEGEFEEADFEDEEGSKEEEMGIDIYACPPGKKISNLSMLSGGERSLTSIALLFAIISYNPPPFSVLDEVEAALDEANSRRFGKILQELSAHTQFVAITHNRETMHQASFLYGVTMGDDGASKVLSVKIDEVGKSGKLKNNKNEKIL